MVLGTARPGRTPRACAVAGEWLAAGCCWLTTVPLSLKASTMSSRAPKNVGRTASKRVVPTDWGEAMTCAPVSVAFVAGVNRADVNWADESAVRYLSATAAVTPEPIGPKESAWRRPERGPRSWAAISADRATKLALVAGGRVPRGPTRNRV